MEFPALTSQAEFEATLQELLEIAQNNPNDPALFLLNAQLTFFENGNRIISGADGDDSLYGTDENENIAGMDGNDFISAGSGDDVLYGGLGNDELVGGAGNDEFLASEGSNRIFGEAGDDLIFAGGLDAESQLVFGGSGNDTINTGDNDDEIDGGAGNDNITSGGGSDVIFAGDGNDRVIAGSTANLGESIENDNDLIDGEGGDDLLFGEFGDDDIFGGAGNDTLDGGGLTTTNITPPDFGGEITNIEPIENAGVDFLTGDAGADTFVFGVEAGAYYASEGFDDVGIVTDFNSTEDKIQLSGSAEDYVLELTSEGTSIFLDADNNGMLSDGDDEIAVVESNSNLDLNSVDFNFV